MGKLVSIIGHICKTYPRKWDLSKGRLTKIIYLSDWKYAIESGSQISDIKWEIFHYGPFVEDVMEAVKANPQLFSVGRGWSVFGSRKEIVSLRDPSFKPELTDGELAAIDHVIDVTKGLPWGQFIRLVYSTYPVLTQPKYTKLNLPDLASRYREEFPETAVV